MLQPSLPTEPACLPVLVFATTCWGLGLLSHVNHSAVGVFAEKYLLLSLACHAGQENCHCAKGNSCGRLCPEVRIAEHCLCVQHNRAAMVQGALQCLVGLCQLAGVQFMSRRVQTEAWPVLLHLLRHGLPHQPNAASPSGGVQSFLQTILLCCCML